MAFVDAVFGSLLHVGMLIATRASVRAKAATRELVAHCTKLLEQ